MAANSLAEVSVNLHRLFRTGNCSPGLRYNVLLTLSGRGNVAELAIYE
jgi:hypothetical protein